jgi:NAD(P)-dependent dehydrogenase (short-subunit alcohol dehydrogenase family)
MKNITLITGGSGGMGLATARLMGADHHVLLSDINPARMESAASGLQAQGISCDIAVCDVTDVSGVRELVLGLALQGRLASVIHTAGLSPQMADAETIMRVNALGTVNIASACYEVAQEGFALVNVASMAAHLMPALLLPLGAYELASSEPDAFLKKALRFTRLIPSDFYRRGLSYGISKNFVMWFSQRSAERFGAKGGRVLSVSPGSFDTEMGRLEEKSGSAEMLRTAALKRFGRVEEIAALLAFCASEKAGYLTGTDILCDGGAMAGRKKPLP